MTTHALPATVLVTGGSRGIGAALVRRLAESGCDVAFSYVHEADTARALAAELQQRWPQRRVLPLQADIGEPAQVTALFEAAVAHFGDLHALVNNAGITGGIGAFRDTSLETLRRVLDVNVLGTMLCAQQALRHWQQRGIAGRMVNLSSVAATLGAAHEYVHYAGAKAAVEAFSLGLAREVAAQGIRVNVVSPGTTQTEIHARGGDPGRPERVAARIPLGRVAQPEEIAEAVLWLLSDASAYATGSVLRVAGGL